MPKKNPLKTFELKPGDLLAEASVRAMSLAAKGAYVILLACLWFHNRERSTWSGLAGDDGSFARLCGVGRKKWLRIRAELVEASHAPMRMTDDVIDCDMLRDQWEARRARQQEVTDKSSKRRSISQKLRFSILQRDHYTCQYCGAKAPDVELQVDHIEPVCAGGPDHPSNLITSCVDCNQGKAGRILKVVP